MALENNALELHKELVDEKKSVTYTIKNFFLCKNQISALVPNFFICPCFLLINALNLFFTGIIKTIDRDLVILYPGEIIISQKT